MVGLARVGRNPKSGAYEIPRQEFDRWIVRGRLQFLRQKDGSVELRTSSDESLGRFEIERRTKGQVRTVLVKEAA